MVVIGLGYVGLPLAQAAVRAGLAVVGLDVSEDVVAGLNAGKSHIDDLSDLDLAEMVSLGFSAVTDPKTIRETRCVVICVPTPLSPSAGPDLGAVEAASRVIADHLSPDTLVVLESTTYPGTTDEVVRPILESSGLEAGENFWLAFSPERVDPGNKSFGIRNTPKVVGGQTDACTKRAVEHYSRFIDEVVAVSGTREAELTKLLENTYRHVNIALVNEMAMFSHDLGIDIWEVIRAASTKPFGFQAFYPGPGVGGHCIPIDPNYLSHAVRTRLGYPFRMVELAQEINYQMPGYVVARAQDLLNHDGKALNGSRVLLLGITYKPDIADQRESPAIPLAQRLRDQGVKVEFHDPLVEVWDAPGWHVTRSADLKQSITDCDLVILLQNHEHYNLETLLVSAQKVLDTRGVVTPDSFRRRL